MLTWDRDPRPDLVEDSAAWRRLIRLAETCRGGGPDSLAAVLDGVRCMGARLVKVEGREQWRITAGAEYTAADYAADRARWLMPHKEALRGLLSDLVVYPETAAELATEGEQSPSPARDA